MNKFVFVASCALITKRNILMQSAGDDREIHYRLKNRE